jgi:hypothetical protein
MDIVVRRLASGQVRLSGIHGRVETLSDDDQRWQKVAPQLPIVQEVAAGIRPM